MGERGTRGDHPLSPFPVLPSSARQMTLLAICRELPEVYICSRMSSTLLLLLLLAPFALLYAVLIVGARRSRRLPRRSASQPLPRVSIIVAARDEERSIERCMAALAGQEYPPELTEIIVVDDESRDGTRAIMERTAARWPGRFTVIGTVPERSKVQGKARAIAQGIDHASGEILLTTDADCTPVSTWVRCAVDHLVEGVEMVGGFTVVAGESAFATVQRLDWAHLQGTASAAAGLGVPLGVVGNNLALRRAAYERVGGYRTVPFTVTEDFALMVAIVRSGGRVVYPCVPDLLVYTLPCDTLVQVVRQKHRWIQGARERAFPGATVPIVSGLALIAMSIAPFFGPVAWSVVWGVKFLCDLVLIAPALSALGHGRTLRWFLLFEFYYVAQVLVIPPLFFRRSVVWKGRAYRRGAMVEG